jgi:hypothetical protein
MEFGCGKAVVELYNVDVLDGDATATATEDIGCCGTGEVITANTCCSGERRWSIATHADCKQLNYRTGQRRRRQFGLHTEEERH